MRRRVVWGGVITALALLIVGLWLFQPWKLVTHNSVDEAVPAAFEAPTATATTPETAATAAPSVTSTPPVLTTAPAGPKVLGEGAFVSQEHPTRGTARVLEQGGARLLRLTGFSTSDGPDVHVWLSAAPAGADWHAYDDGRYVRLGKLKATDGNINYPIPADADLTGMRSVVIWCDRFNVAFGSAPVDL
ncbi:DM13 domain-containing protein [Actinokineospora sp. NBRC 105648]|uniref:DM13 domain-containing protein n=1 Tax=Actinokineospora sp. NBRC 105648 TaxID=3032206 RepID=UPI002555502D|nr:DM13 domain-containing protein [Actinokineospora sp. NBRC 105648]